MKKKHVFVLVKFCVTVAVVWYVFHTLGENGRASLWNNLRSAKPSGLALAFLACLGGMTLGILRWRMLLRVQGILLSGYQVTWITATGSFFNTFLPGGTGGDVMKAWYAAEAAPDRKPQAVLSIVVDRIIGLMGLIILVFVVMLMNLKLVMDQERTRHLAASLGFMLVSVVVAAMLGTQRRRFTAFPWWGRVWRFVPGKNILVRLGESFDMYQHHPRVLMMALLLSVGVHALMCILAWQVGGAIGIQGVDIRHYFAYFPLINTISAGSPTPMGVGVREWACMFFFDVHHVPKPQSVALAWLYLATLIAVNILSGVLFFLGKPRSWSSPPKDGQMV